MDTPPEQATTDMELNAPSDAWDCWFDDELKLDSSSSLEISNSLWSDFTQNNETVARSLFARVPPSQAKVPSSFVGERDSPQTIGSWHDPSLATGSMLRLLVDEHANESPRLSDSVGDHTDASLINTPDDLEASGPSSSNSMWFMANDESVNNDAMEQSAESWMAECFNDGDVGTSLDEFHYHEKPIDVTAMEITPNRVWGASEHGLPCKNRQFRRATKSAQELLLSQRGVNPKKSVFYKGKQFRHSPPQSISDTQNAKVRLKPIVYPFALVKPCGIQGDATLKDINQRINMISPSETASQPSNKACTSTSSPFSGKPVVAVTKIHTEGKGTITIMRTRS